MSYNIMKKRAGFAGATNGTIENIVDTHTDQTIAGSKTFTHTITSSADTMLSGAGDVSASFYHGDGRYLVNITASHVSLSNGPTGSIQFHNTGGQISGSGNFRFLTSSNTVVVDGDISASGNISASFFYGDGRYLTNITASSISGQLSASQVAHSMPLTNSAGVLTAKTNLNRVVGSHPTLGIGLDTTAIITSPQNGVNDAHYLITTDGSNNYSVITFGTIESTLNIDAANLIGTINNNRLPANISVTSITASSHISSSTYYGDGSNLTGITASAGGSAAAQGPIGSLQFHTGSGGISGSANILFLTSSNTLAVNGDVSASFYHGDGRYLTNITASSVVSASLSASQILHASPLTNSAGVLDVLIKPNSGIVDDSGLAFDLGQIPAVPPVVYNDSIFFAISGSSAQNKRVPLSWLEDNIEVDATNLSGTISNSSLPSNISVTSISASSHISSSAFVGNGSQLTNLSVSTFTRTAVTTSTYSVLTSDYYVGVNFTGSGGSTLTLPDAATMNSGQTIIIKDESGQAASYNILINADTGQEIDGQASQTIESNYGAISLYSDGVDKYFIF